MTTRDLTPKKDAPRKRHLLPFGLILALVVGIALLGLGGTKLHAASGAERSESSNAAAISALNEAIRVEMDRIAAMEQRLDKIQHPEGESDEMMELRKEIRSEHARIEAMQTSVNELAEFSPPAFAPPPPAAAAPAPQAAEAPFPTLSAGIGIQTSYKHTEPDGAKGIDNFGLGHARIYLSGDITPHFSAIFNTDYDPASNKMGIQDALGAFHTSPKFNVWVGRLLPPSDRDNLTGPFYSNLWGVYTDGIQDGYNFIFQGRDNGIVYWGDFSKLKVSVGGFDGASLTGKRELLGAARVQYDFWDAESGYFLNSTYYGDKNILAIGGASQVQDGKTASTVDFMLEKKVDGHGAFTIESEYSRYNGLGGYIAGFKSQGIYGLASFLFPKPMGMGQFEILGKYAKADFTHGPTASFNQKTTEVNFDYVVKQFDARVMSFFRDTRYSDAGPADFWEAGVGLQVQISKGIH